MATAIALPGFNDPGRSVTPIFILMDDFLRSAKNKKKSIGYKFDFFDDDDGFAKRTIEFRFFKLFTDLVGAFKSLLKGYVW